MLKDGVPVKLPEVSSRAVSQSYFSVSTRKGELWRFCKSFVGVAELLLSMLAW